MAGTAYLDASALVKLATPEPESPALVRYLQSIPALASSRLGATELRRACIRFRLPNAHAVADAVLEPLTLVDVSPPLLETAGRLAPPELRTLDAIHLATVLSIGADDIDVITYDNRLASAARKFGLKVVQPGVSR